MICGKDSAGDAQKRAKKKRTTSPVAFELETDATARRQQERQKQRHESASQLKAQQKLTRAKKTEEYMHLRLRQRQSADERKRSLHTNGSAVKVGGRHPHPQMQPQTARGAASEVPTLRAVLERQRPQSAKPDLQSSRQHGVASSASQKELVTGARIRVRHWENWLCHSIPTTATHLTASQSSPLLHTDEGGHQSKKNARPTDQLTSTAGTAKKTNIVVDMRRLRVLDDSEDDYNDQTNYSRPASRTRQAWGSDPAGAHDEDQEDGERVVFY